MVILGFVKRDENISAVGFQYSDMGFIFFQKKKVEILEIEKIDYHYQHGKDPIILGTIKQLLVQMN